MLVTKKAISRRTVLRGVGAAVGLPLLDAMIPAFATAATTPATARRLGVVYHPNGVIYDKWLPTGTGADFEFSPTLAGLKPFRDQLIVVTGLFAMRPRRNGDGGGDHSRASGSYLTGVHIKKSDSQLENGISMDQIAAKGIRARHSALVAANDRRRQQPGGRLRSGLQLRLQHDALLDDADVAAHGRKQSARALRADVRLERQHGCARARRASQPGSEPARFGQRSRESTSEEAGPRRQPEGGRLSHLSSRCRAANPESGRTELKSAARRSPSPPVFRTYSRSTSGCCTICNCWPINRT